MKIEPEKLRSYRWFGPDTMRGFQPSVAHASNWDTGGEDFTGKPVIGIINTWSEINPCHAHLRERAGSGEARCGGKRADSRWRFRRSPSRRRT